MTKEELAALMERGAVALRMMAKHPALKDQHTSLLQDATQLQQMAKRVLAGYQSQSYSKHRLDPSELVIELPDTTNSRHLHLERATT